VTSYHQIDFASLLERAQRADRGALEHLAIAGVEAGAVTGTIQGPAGTPFAGGISRPDRG
jgi:hypothetical protein